MPFWRRKKKEAKGEIKIETKPAQIQETSLERICKEYERPDLYEPLSLTIFVEPRDRDVESLLSEESSMNYSIAATVMLYEGNPELAKEYFEKTIELGTTRKKHYLSVVDNIDIVTKIVMDWWKEEGKYEEVKKKEK
jgi:hypothetical protein